MRYTKGNKQNQTSLHNFTMLPAPTEVVSLQRLLLAAIGNLPTSLKFNMASSHGKLGVKNKSLTGS